MSIMQASLTENFLPRVLPAFALVLSLGLFAGTCSTGNPGTVFSPSDPGEGGGGGGGGAREDGPSAAPAAGSLLIAGVPQLEAVAPLDKAKDIDIHAPIVLWFTESLRADTITAASLILRPLANPEFPVTTQSTWLAGGRCLVLQPLANLSLGTEFELVATDDITDLDGERLKIPSNGRLARFTTGTAIAGTPPVVLGSFPPAGSTDIPNDTSVIVAFSKAMDFTGITDAVSITNVDGSTAGDYDLSADLANRHAGNRVFEFPHQSDADDLGARMRLRVKTTVTDAEFVPQSLSAEFTATWDSLAFGRPSSIAFDPAAFGGFAPAVNLTNQDAFPVRVTLPISVLASDSVSLLVHEDADSPFLSDTLPAGGGVLDFSLDLTDGGDAVFGSSSDLILAGFVERGGVRTTVQTFRDAEDLESVVSHDLVRPLLFNYGPPVGQFGSQFVTDLPRFRPYGRASEPIAQIDSSFPPTVLAKSRTMPEPPSTNFFVGPFFDPLVVTEGPLLFDILLTDLAGNEASLASPGSVAFRGFIGMTPLGASDDVRVVAFDRDSLTLMSGATVHIEDLGGGNEDSGTTGSDGSFTFTGRAGAQTVTVQLTDFESVSVVGFNATEISIPLIFVGRAVAALGPQVSGLTSGDLTVSSNLLVDSAGGVDFDAQQTYAIESIFTGVDARLNRLGWYSAFHDVEAFNAPDRYYRFFGFDDRVILEPNIGSTLVPPVLPMVESTNQMASSTDYIYPLSVTPGVGYGALVDSNTLVGTVIPGMPGFIGLGAGSVDLPGGAINGDAELELSLHDRAVTEGASASTVQVQVYVADGSGNEGLARTDAALAITPGTVAITLPDVPTDGVWGSTGAYPFTHDFTNTLGGSGGFYRLTIEDTAATPNRWHLWVAASVSAAGSLQVDLPTLKDSAGGAVGTPPLEILPGGAWSAYVEAFSMGLGFFENGFFFTELERDSSGWSRSAVGGTLDF